MKIYHASPALSPLTDTYYSITPNTPLNTSDTSKSHIPSTLEPDLLCKLSDLTRQTCALLTAEEVSQNISQMIREAINIMQAKLDAKESKVIAQIREGTSGMAYVGAPYGTHVWDPIEGEFIFVGSGGTHGSPLLLLLIDPNNEDETQIENPLATDHRFYQSEHRRHSQI